MNQAAAIERPYFRSLSAALFFAYRSVDVPIEEASVIGGWIGAGDEKRRVPRDWELEPQPRGVDRLAMSGMMLSGLRELALHEQAVLAASYSHGHQRIKAQQYLRDFVLPRLSATIRRRRLVYELVASFFGKPVMFNELAIRFEIHPNTVTRQSAQVSDILDTVSSRAVDAATTLYKDRGILM